MMRTTALAAALLAVAVSGAAAPAPIPRRGPGGCPAGYQVTGNLCVVPTGRDARACVERRGGSCPANYVVSGG